MAKPSLAWDVPPGMAKPTLLGQNLARLTLLPANAFDWTRGTEKHLSRRRESFFSSLRLELKSRVMVGDGSPWVHVQSSYFLLLQLVSRDFMAI